MEKIDKIKKKQEMIRERVEKLKREKIEAEKKVIEERENKRLNKWFEFVCSNNKGKGGLDKGKGI